MRLPSGFRRSPMAWATAVMMASLLALALVGPPVWGAAADRPDPRPYSRDPPRVTRSAPTVSAVTCSPGS